MGMNIALTRTQSTSKAVAKHNEVDNTEKNREELFFVKPKASLKIKNLTEKTCGEIQLKIGISSTTKSMNLRVFVDQYYKNCSFFPFLSGVPLLFSDANRTSFGN